MRSIMPTCPNGHHNPRNQPLCSVCDALISAGTGQCPPRRAWRLVVPAIALVASIAAAGVGIAAWHTEPVKSSVPATSDTLAAVQQWWPTAHDHFYELQNALMDTRGALDSALERKGGSMLDTSCHKLHDAGAVKLRSDLPSPDRLLTAELDAAINDSHEAAHMCLAAIAGSQNNYAGEFVAELDQAEKDLITALDMVNKSLSVA